jgi:hypothetical protein
MGDPQKPRVDVLVRTVSRNRHYPSVATILGQPSSVSTMEVDLCSVRGVDDLDAMRRAHRMAASDAMQDALMALVEWCADLAEDDVDDDLLPLMAAARAAIAKAEGRS